MLMTIQAFFNTLILPIAGKVLSRHEIGCLCLGN